jgi:hypothetical protein
MRNEKPPLPENDAKRSEEMNHLQSLLMNLMERREVPNLLNSAQQNKSSPFQPHAKMEDGEGKAARVRG